MYIVFSFVMLSRGVAEAIIMRAQQALALHGGLIEQEHYSQIFSTHGTIMIFFVAMPLIAGFINYVMPLQIGARDVAFPGDESNQFLLDRCWRNDADDLAGDRRVLRWWLDRLPSVYRSDLQSWSWTGLLDLGFIRFRNRINA